MFPLTITLHNKTQLAAVLAALGETPADVTGSAPIALKDIEAPGKSTSAAAPASPAKPTARSSPTAAAVAAGAPEKTAAATPPAAAPAAAPSPASTAAGDAPFAYDTLRKLVLKLLPTHADQLNEIAARHGQPHGATTFKTLPPECWAAAYADVQALEASGV